MFKMKMGNHAQSFYCYNFSYNLVQINLLKLWLNSIYNVLPMPFRLLCGWDDLIAAVSLLAQCTK